MKTRSEMNQFRNLGVCLLFLCLLGVSAHAELYILGKITSGAPGSCPDAFTMEVTDVVGQDQVLFTFTNDCDNEGVLTRLYFMKNELMSYNSIDEDLTSDGVLFSLKEGNAMLPGGHPLGFTPQNSFGIYADPAGPKNGLHYEEMVAVLFDLAGGTSFDDIIGAIDGQSLGVGVHAQSLPGGMSASFSTIPEPATLVLIGIGALLLRHKRRDTAQ
jgi:hypothetical protein